MRDDHAVVRRLVAALRDAPTALPLGEIMALHAQGRDVVVDATEDTVVAVVVPRRDPRLDVLTEREQHVATLVAAGRTNRQIAAVLGIAVGTVKDHVHAVLSKTGLETRTSLAAAWHGGATATAR